MINIGSRKAISIHFWNFLICFKDKYLSHFVAQYNLYCGLAHCFSIYILHMQGQNINFWHSACYHIVWKDIFVIVFNLSCLCKNIYRHRHCYKNATYNYPLAHITWCTSYTLFNFLIWLLFSRVWQVGECISGVLDTSVRSLEEIIIVACCISRPAWRR